MIDWLNLMRQFTPYMSGVGKEAWDAWHTQIKQQTQQLLEKPDSFLPQVIGLQLLVDEWLTEQEKEA